MPQRSRRATNISIDTAIIEEAKEFRIDISEAAEDGIARAIAREKGNRWAAENADVIRTSNDYVERHGLPLEKYRLF